MATVINTVREHLRAQLRRAADARRRSVLAQVGLIAVAVSVAVAAIPAVPSIVMQPDPSHTPSSATTSAAASFSPPAQPPQPWAGRFEATGDLQHPRIGATALLLRDGRVLVLGGTPFHDRGLPPEIYDPATGTFTTIDPILPRIQIGAGEVVRDYRDYTATVLADGRVLFTGGRLLVRNLRLPEAIAGPPPVLVSEAVIFDPVSGTTSRTGAMGVHRAGHAAVRLADGRVLVVGGTSESGDGGEESVASAELYDPSTGRFSPTGPMAVDRADLHGISLQVLALASGRVLVSGGARWREDGDGSGQGGPVAPAAELYDPTSGSFASVPGGVPPGDRLVLLLLGGTIERLDLATGVRTDITPEPTDLIQRYGPGCRDLPFGCPRGMTTTMLPDGVILIAGGRFLPAQGTDAGRVGRTWAEVLHPGSLGVTPTGPLVEPRSGHTAVLLADGRVLLLGGSAPGPGGGVAGRVLGSAELFTTE